MSAGLLATVLGLRWLPSSVALLDSVLHMVRDLGLIGIAAFVGVQAIVAFTGILPASLIGITAGAIYSLPVGFALATCSTIAGAFAAFALSRSLLRPMIARLLVSRARLKDFDAMLARDGWQFVFLLRLSPIMPFAATSYALGLSSISMRDYWIGSLASLPSLLGYVVIGSLTSTGLSALSHDVGPLHWLVLSLGIVATIAVTLRIGTLAKLAVAA